MVTTRTAAVSRTLLLTCQRTMLALTLAALVGDAPDVTSQRTIIHGHLGDNDGTSGAGDSELIKVLLARLVWLVRLRVRVQVLALPQSRALLLISRLSLIEVTRSLPVLPVSPSTFSGSCPGPGSLRSASGRPQVVRSSLCLIKARVLIGSEVGGNARVLLIRS